MLGAVLRDLYAVVRGIDHRLLDAVDLMPEDEGGGAVGVDHLSHIREEDAVVRLLHGEDQVALLACLPHRLEGVSSVAPVDRLLRAEGTLVQISVTRLAGDATEDDPPQSQRIGGTEDRPHIEQTPYVVQYHEDGALRRCGVLLRREPSHLLHSQFLSHS